MAESFRIITESEMKKGIFTSKDFPIVLGIGSKLLAYTKDIFYGYYVNEEIVGISKFEIEKEKCKIKIIEIKPEWQNKGYGSKIIKEIEGKAKKSNVKEIKLIPRDYRVYNFYEKNGYTFTNGILTYLFVKRMR